MQHSPTGHKHHLATNFFFRPSHFPPSLHPNWVKLFLKACQDIYFFPSNKFTTVRQNAYLHSKLLNLYLLTQFSRALIYATLPRNELLCQLFGGHSTMVFYPQLTKFWISIFIHSLCELEKIRQFFYKKDFYTLSSTPTSTILDQDDPNARNR